MISVTAAGIISFSVKRQECCHCRLAVDLCRDARDSVVPAIVVHPPELVDNGGVTILIAGLDAIFDY